MIFELYHRYGKANGEPNEEEQAVDVQVVAHLQDHIWDTIDVQVVAKPS